MELPEMMFHVAKAINGPHDEAGIHKPEQLAMLREQLWGNLTDQEKGEKLGDAQSAIAAVFACMEAFIHSATKGAMELAKRDA